MIYKVEVKSPTADKADGHNEVMSSRDSKIMNSLNESKYAIEHGEQFVTFEPTAFATVSKPTKQRLKAKTMTFDDTSRQRPFTATMQKPELLRPEQSMFPNPLSLVKKNRHGLSSILPDSELFAQLPPSTDSNILLRRNPLIIEKKTVQNSKEFYRAAAISVREAIELNQMSVMGASSLTRGKGGNDHVHLVDFLQRLRETMPAPILQAQSSLRSISSFAPRQPS